MSLPEITLPEVVLPFEIPTLIHPFIDHFLVAVPMVILFIELLNFVMKKKAVSGVNFLLIFIVIIAATAQYLLGQGSTEERQLLLTYLMLGSVVLLFLKLILMLSQKVVLKLLYLLALGSFVFGILLYSQAKEKKCTCAKSTTEVAASTQAVPVETKTETVVKVIEESTNVETPKVETLKIDAVEEKAANVAETVVEEVTAVVTPTPKERERTGNVLEKAASAMEDIKEKSIETVTKTLDSTVSAVSAKVLNVVNDINNTVLNGITDTTK